jgi:hypothetical protein
MSNTAWQVIQQVWCDRAQAEACLLEERVYPGEALPNAAPAYQARARKCSLGLECNLAGCACRYAFSNPNYDPFA